MSHSLHYKEDKICVGFFPIILGFFFFFFALPRVAIWDGKAIRLCTFLPWIRGYGTSYPSHRLSSLDSQSRSRACLLHYSWGPDCLSHTVMVTVEFWFQQPPLVDKLMLMSLCLWTARQKGQKWLKRCRKGCLSSVRSRFSFSESSQSTKERYWKMDCVFW